MFTKIKKKRNIFNSGYIILFNNKFDERKVKIINIKKLKESYLKKYKDHN